MATKKIRIQDMVDNSIGSSQIIDGSIKLPEIKIVGGVDNVSGATLSYDGVSPTPTIKQFVDALVLSTDYVQDKHYSDGVQTAFQTPGNRMIDIVAPVFVWFNGQLQTLGAGADYTITTTVNPNDTISFTYTPEAGGHEIVAFYQVSP